MTLKKKDLDILKNFKLSFMNFVQLKKHDFTPVYNLIKLTPDT